MLAGDMPARGPRSFVSWWTETSSPAFRLAATWPAASLVGFWEKL